MAAILFFPWGAFALVLLLLVLLSMNGPPGVNPGWQFFVGMWFGLGVAADVLFGSWARRKLRTKFRLIAEQRYAPAPGLWKRFLGSAK